MCWLAACEKAAAGRQAEVSNSISGSDSEYRWISLTVCNAGQQATLLNGPGSDEIRIRQPGWSFRGDQHRGAPNPTEHRHSPNRSVPNLTTPGCYLWRGCCWDSQGQPVYWQ